jgi:ATP-dependent RNA helicase RhlE
VLVPHSFPRFREIILQFDALGLSPAILDAVAEKGYSKPSPIQEKAIPPVLAGRDVMAAAQTGTGKTAGFTLPLLQRLSDGPRVKANQVRALVLTPTRELAAQVGENVAGYGKNLPLKSEVVFGGVKINPQMMRLRGGVDVLVATPGRLLDLFNQNAIRFDQLEVLILDEADRMLDMGFIHDIRKILKIVPEQRQNLMFSATFSDDIRALAKTIVRDPVEVSVTPPNSTAKSVKQWLVPVDKKQKSRLLCHLIHEHDWQQVLVFSRTKHGANRLAKQLEAAGIKAAAIHGNKSQGARTRALADFKAGTVRALVATDIAARGLDIDQLPQVVNYDLPNVAEDYVHRIGRTGRAGASGQAVSLVCADEANDLFGIERLIQQLIPRQLVDGFEPQHNVPERDLDTRPIKPKKPKKPKKPRGEHQDGQRSGDTARGHKPAGKNKRHKANSGSRQGRDDGKQRQSTGNKKAVNGNAKASPQKVRDANGDIDGNRPDVSNENRPVVFDNYGGGRRGGGRGKSGGQQRNQGRSAGRSSGRRGGGRSGGQAGRGGNSRGGDVNGNR